MSATATEIPEKFLDMYFLMGGNPNYKDMQHMTFNKNTGLIDDNTKTCTHCLEIIPLNAQICSNCRKAVL